MQKKKKRGKNEEIHNSLDSSGPLVEAKELVASSMTPSSLDSHLPPPSSHPIPSIHYPFPLPFILHLYLNLVYCYYLFSLF